MRASIARVGVLALLLLTSAYNSAAQTQNIFFVPPTYPGAGQTLTADFNGDGKPDLVSSDGTVLLGNGDGTFKTGTSIGLCPCTLIASADFNGDGKPDLVVAFSTSNTFSVLLGKGDGTFQAPIITAVSSPVSFLTVGDLNGDGKPDVLALLNLSTTLFTYLGKGDGTFAAGINSGGQAVGILGDFNGDHKLDLASSAAVQLGNGDGTFQAPLPFTSGPFGGSIYEAIGDFNGDGKLDLALSASNNGTTANPSLTQVLLGKGDGTFQPAAQVGTTGGPIAAGDFNKDGKTDLVVEASPFVQAFLSNGDGTFAPKSFYNLMSSAPAVGNSVVPSVLVADFNGDGKLDLAATNTLLLGNGDGTFQGDQAIPGISLGSAIAADFNNDGHPDLAVMIGPVNDSNLTDTVGIYLNDGKGGLSLAHTYPVPVADNYGSGDVVAAAVDLNGDGNLDLVFYPDSKYSWDVIVMLGNGDGSFRPAMTFAGVRNANGYGFVTGIAFADLNGDKKPDAIVVAGTYLGAPGSMFVFLGNGDGTFAAPVQYFAGNGDGNVVAADFNKDGKMDVAVGTSNGIALLLGNGDGTFQPATMMATSLNANYSRWLVTADLNGDGNVDLVASGTSAFQVFLGKGNGNFTPLTPTNDSTNGPLQLADFNGDGKLDLLGSTFTGYGLLLGQGDGTFGSFLPVIPFLDKMSVFPLVADFNGDGKPDIAVIRTGGLFYLFNTGAHLASDFQVSASPLSPATVMPGGSTSSTVTLTPVAGFTTVSLTCSGAPAMSTCAVSPQSVSLSGSSAVTAMVTVTTTPHALLLPVRLVNPRTNDRLVPMLLAALGMIMLLGLHLWRCNGRFRWIPVFTLLILLCLGTTLTSCGGGSSSGGSGGGSGGNSGTPAGTYTLTVSANATSGSTTLTHTTKLTLVVQ